MAPNKPKRKKMIDAIAAAIRWNASLDHCDKYINDGNNLHTLGHMLHHLNHKKKKSRHRELTN